MQLNFRHKFDFPKAQSTSVLGEFISVTGLNFHICRLRQSYTELIVCRLNSFPLSLQIYIQHTLPTKSTKNQRQKWDINFPASQKTEVSVRDHYFFAASVKKPQMWNTALAKQVLLFALHSRTPGLNKQTLECEWTARYMGSDSHPWCVPADDCGILPGINLTPGSWKMK